MPYLFENCASLKELDVSNFDTNNAIDISGLFLDCSLIEFLDISNFNTYNVKNMSHLF